MEGRETGTPLTPPKGLAGPLEPPAGELLPLLFLYQDFFAVAQRYALQRVAVLRSWIADGLSDQFDQLIQIRWLINNMHNTSFA